MKFIFAPDFFYSGAALLSLEGRMTAAKYRETAGKCLGGGVLSSRDLDWFAAGRKGAQPEQFVPRKKLFGYDSQPQSALPSEWIALEYALILAPAYGPAIIVSWDDVGAIAVTLKQGKDLHARIEGNFPADIRKIGVQANAQSITNLMEIAASAGVPAFK